MLAVQTKSLSKQYGDVHAINQLDLQVPRGIIYGFIGRNGAGKTTTIRLLTGLAKPSSGFAWVAGVPISDHQALSWKIGYLPEEPAFYQWMTPFEFLDHIGRIFRISSKERRYRINDLLEIVDLKTAANRRIKGFSRGMRQRLGLAQALINQPEVLFLDEPTSALDPEGRRTVLNLILNLKVMHTVFMSTHILADAEEVCDRVAIIDRGKLIIEDEKIGLQKRYSMPILELECRPEDAAKFPEILYVFRDEPWVIDIQIEGTLTKIHAASMEKAQETILSAILQTQISLVRFEWVEPTLESIFLNLIGENQNK
ncbi:MAG: ABC transporter ATP-binding protein [Brevefilum sp.]|nr:ABC transporter ATP-binding protein [Brevefilum sp.]